MRPEPGTWREGLDLHSQLAVPLCDALLGGTATVSTLRGPAQLAIPPGTQHGALLAVAGAGVDSSESARGAHVFRVRLQLPREVSGAEEALLRRLAALQEAAAAGGSTRRRRAAASGD